MNKRLFTRNFLMASAAVTVCFFSFAPALRAETVDKTKPFVASVTSSENAIALEDEVTVQVINIKQLLDEAREKNKNITLFINGIPIKGIYHNSYINDGANGKLGFFIDHSNAETIALWDQLTLSRGSAEIFTRQVSISVGLEDQEPIFTQVNNFTLVLARKNWFYISVFILIVLFIFFVTLAVKTDILRDAGPNPPGGGRKPYSLALTQMAAWFFVIISSWLLLYVVKHTFNTITDSLVILMGISAGTGLGGVTIDSNRKTVATNQRSQGFSKDILSDSNGISFHRFQVFAWTFIMVAVFIRQVTAYLVMPEFSPALLTLMGISSGTYLGFKVSEKPGPGDDAGVKESNGGG